MVTERVARPDAIDRSGEVPESGGSHPSSLKGCLLANTLEVAGLGQMVELVGYPTVRAVTRFRIIHV